VPVEGGLVTARERFEDALRNAGKYVDTKKALCPAHDDSNASLSIGDRRDSKGIVVKCHAGCDYQDVLAALSMAPRDLFDDDGMREIYAPKRDYRYPDGRVVHRKPDKSFPQSGNTKGNSLFHADRIGAAETVCWPEGEKDVEAIEAVGGVAVCSAMGAGKADRADTSPLRGKHVIVIADKDEPGRQHAQQVSKILVGVAESVRIVEAAVGKDFADHFAAGKGLDELVPIAPTDGAELLDDLVNTLTRFVIFADKHSAAAVALWIAATHALPWFDCAPRLVITSPEKRCGKTRLLDIIEGTCNHPLATSDATVAAIFRSIPPIDENTGDSIAVEATPTLIIDEADAIFGNSKVAEQHEDLRKLLNAGHQRGRPALRCVGPHQTPTQFPTFAMAVLAGIGSMPDTITDRAANIAMRRRAHGERVAQFRRRRDTGTLKEIRYRLNRWVWSGADHDLSKTDTRNNNVRFAAERSMPVEDRAADTWEPLVAIADAAGGHWPGTARAACKALVAAADAADETDSLNTKLLADIKQIFADTRVPFLASKELVVRLRGIEESPWVEFDYNPSKLAYRLKEFGVKSRRDPAGAVRGYSLESLTDAFSRYLRQSPSDPSESLVDTCFPSDAHKPSDASTRQTGSTRQNENTGLPAILTGLTGSDGSTASNGTPAPGTVAPATREQQAAYRDGKCIDCRASKPSAGRPRCNECHRIHQNVMAGYDQ
jgi:hypothetical protein